MKLILPVAAIVALTLASCKKDYTCKCTSQVVGAPTKTESTFTIKDATRKTAYNHCAHLQTTYTAGTATVVYDEYCSLE
jgi:hypothetical protein